MLCSAPQPSEATWFAASPHWPAAPGAGMASPPAPHHLRDARDQTSSPSLPIVHAEGITIPLQLPRPGSPFPVATSSSISTEEPAAFALSQAAAPAWQRSHRCQPSPQGQRGVSHGHGSRHGGLCPWHRTAAPGRGARCQSTPMSRPGRPRAHPRTRQSGDMGATGHWWDFSCEPPGRAQRRGISATDALTHFVSASHFFLTVSFNASARADTASDLAGSGQESSHQNRPIKPPHGDFFSSAPTCAEIFAFPACLRLPHTEVM